MAVHAVHLELEHERRGIAPALLVWAFFFATSPRSRGCVRCALVGWTKFASLIVVPLWSGYPDARDTRSRLRASSPASCSRRALDVRRAPLRARSPAPQRGGGLLPPHVRLRSSAVRRRSRSGTGVSTTRTACPTCTGSSACSRCRSWWERSRCCRLAAVSLAAPARGVHRRAARRVRGRVHALVVPLPAVVLPVRRLCRARTGLAPPELVTVRASGRRSRTSKPGLGAPLGGAGNGGSRRPRPRSACSSAPWWMLGGPLVLCASRDRRHADLPRDTSTYGRALGWSRTGTSDIEYPPGALAAFLAPSHLGGVYNEERFGVLMAACGMLRASSSRRCRGRLGGGRAVPRGIAAAHRRAMAMTRFDFWPAALMAAAVVAFMRNQHKLGWGLALAAAIAAKLFPRGTRPTRDRLGRSAAAARAELAWGLVIWTVCVLAASFRPVPRHRTARAPRQRLGSVVAADRDRGRSPRRS